MISSVTQDKPPYYIRSFTKSTFSLTRVFNFGEVGSFLQTKQREEGISYPSAIPNNGINQFCLNNILNAQKTLSESMDGLTNKANVYYYVPLTIVSDGCLEINNRDQINKDFFINTIGIDESRWDLDYINIEDEYGLPIIIY
jgi:hypothetical protein